MQETVEDYCRDIQQSLQNIVKATTRGLALRKLGQPTNGLEDLLTEVDGQARGMLGHVELCIKRFGSTSAEPVFASSETPGFVPSGGADPGCQVVNPGCRE